MDSLFIFILGAIIGSFTSVSIYRIPLNKSIIYPMSNCPYCHTKLRIRDLIPLISWLLLKGHCRYCNAIISSRYFWLEFISGGLFVLAYWRIGIDIELLKAFCLIYFLLLVGYIDYDYQLILNKVMVAMCCLGIIIKVIIMLVEKNIMLDKFYLSADWLNSYYGFIIGGSLIFLLVVISKGGMGIGDIWFTAILGFWLGAEKVLLTVFLAFVLGGLICIFLLLLKVKKRKDYIAFGPFLAISAFISYLYGVEIIWQYQCLLN